MCSHSVGEDENVVKWKWEEERGQLCNLLEVIVDAARGTKTI